MRSNKTTTILAALGLIACGGGVPPADAPVPVQPEDDVAPRRGLTCRVTKSVALEGRAELDSPTLARAAEGGVLAGWIGRSDGVRSVQVQRLSPSLETNGPAAELDDPVGMPLSPRLAACGESVWIAWQRQEPEGGHTIRVATLSGDGHGSPTVAGRGTSPDLGCTGDRGALTWSRRDRGIQDVYLRWLEVGGELGDRRRISGDTDSASEPVVACAQGRCGLAWSDRRHVYAEIYGRVVDDGQGVESGAEAALRVSDHDQTESGAGGAYGPGLGTRDGLRFLVAWHDTRSRDESEIYAAVMDQRGRRGSEHRISRSPAPSVAPAVAVCDDVAAVAWRDGRHGPPAVVVAALDDRGRRASASITLSRGPQESSAPAVACGSDSSVIVAWTSPVEDVPRVQLAMVRCR